MTYEIYLRYGEPQIIEAYDYRYKRMENGAILIEFTNEVDDVVAVTNLTDLIHLNIR